MASLTPAQIARYAYNAGFRGAALNQAVAIALAESGGRTDAYNPETAAGTAAGSGSRGLWQIYGTAHPEYNNPGAFDPQVNANAAFKVFREAGNRFTPWSTYNAGIAKPRADYSKTISGAPQPARTIGRAASSQTPNPVKTLAAGVQGWQDLARAPVQPSAIAGAPGSGPGPTADPGGLSLPFGLNKLFGLDAAFIFFGGLFVVIGLIFLFVAGAVKAAGNEDVRNFVKAAATTAAL